MSIASRISASLRKPSATVTIDGRRWDGVLSLSTDRNYGGNISAGTVVGRNPPVNIVEGRTIIQWSWGYDGQEVAGFTGVVTRILSRAYPNTVTLSVADLLWFADIRRGDIATSPLNNIAASTAVEQILQGAGLTRLAIPELPASGSEWVGTEWVLGTLTPVSFSNTTALAAAQQICGALGYWLYCDPSGIVRAIYIERTPSDAPFRTLRYGTDFLLASPPEAERDAASVRNRVVVNGANTGVQGVQITDARQTGAADREEQYTNTLIEYVNLSEAGAASAEGVATRLLTLYNRRPRIVRIGRLLADPRLQVGMTVAIECALIGIASVTPFFVYGVSTSLDFRTGAFVQQLILDGGVGNAGYTTVPNPIASFQWRIVRETINGTAVTELFLDASGSTSLTNGEIVEYDWSTATATALGTPTTATGVKAMFVYPAATTSASVTLTVIDTSSKLGTLTQTIDLAGDDVTEPVTQVISVAFGSAWAITPDGGATWRVEATGDSTVVPESGPLLSTRATGSTGLRFTADALATASETYASIGAQINDIYNTPNTERVWIAAGSEVYRSTDNGLTATLWATLPATVRRVIEDPALPNSVFYLVGADLRQTITATPSGSDVLYAGPTGATARHIVRGQSGATTWICYTDTFVGSPLQRVEGPISATFPSLTPAVTEIKAIALSPDETLVYAWDSEGRGFVVDSETGIATQLAGATLDASYDDPQHALYDTVADIVYVAAFGSTQGAVYKYFPLIDQIEPFYIGSAGQQAHRVGIGEPVASPVEVVAVTTSTDTPGGVWHFTLGAWSLKNSGLPSGWNWGLIVVNPFDPDRWLLVGQSGAFVRGTNITTGSSQSPIWETTDAGATWSPIALPDGGGLVGQDFLGIQSAGYTSDNQYFIVGQYGVPDIVITTANFALWRGAIDTAVTRAIIGPTNNYDVHRAVAGQDGDVAFTYRITGANTYRYGYVARGSNTLVDVGANGETDPVGQGFTILARVGTGRGIVMKSTIGNTRSVPDYRSAAGALQVGTIPGTTLTGLANGEAYLGGTGGSTIIRIDDPLTSLVGNSISLASVGVNGSQQRGYPVVAIVGAVLSDFVGYSFDGETFETIPTPSTGLNRFAIAAIARED